MILDLDFYSSIRVDLDYFYSCEESGCTDEGVCRCAEIISPQIVFVDTHKISKKIYEYYFDKTQSTIRNNTIQSLFGITEELSLYSIDRILRTNEIWLEDLWDIKISHGYYGQECDGVYLKFDIANKIQQQIESALNLNSKKELVRYLLEIEYGHVIDKLKNCDFNVISVSINDIVFGNNNHFNNVYKSDHLEHYSDKHYPGIRGIVTKLGDKYQLVDGYHRIVATENANIKVILAD